jgi:hypothetical protein
MYLWLKQKGDGCDYTIGCGEKLIPIENKEEIAGKLEDLGFDGTSDDRTVEQAIVFGESESVMDIVAEVARRWYEEAVSRERKDNEEELIELAAKLGKKVV